MLYLIYGANSEVLKKEHSGFEILSNVLANTEKGKPDVLYQPDAYMNSTECTEYLKNMLVYSRLVDVFIYTHREEHIFLLEDEGILYNSEDVRFTYIDENSVVHDIKILINEKTGCKLGIKINKDGNDDLKIFNLFPFRYDGIYPGTAAELY